MKTIRRYKNRKYYDFDLNHYITLSSIARYSLLGISFAVIDHTDKDITNAAVFDAFTPMLRGTLKVDEITALATRIGVIK